MGNNSSSEEEFVEAGKGDNSGVSPVTPPTEGTRARSDSKTRRIVKAAKPASSSKDDTKDSASQRTAPSEDESGYHYNKKHTVPKVIAESPSVAREIEIEQQQESRKERMQSMTERQKAKREKLFHERRSGKKEGADLQPNPFSRFLSVFSVEPAHPEHKRAYEGGSDDDEWYEPEEKRLRPTDELKTEKTVSAIWNSTTAVAVVVALAAIGVAAVLQLSRRS